MLAAKKSFYISPVRNICFKFYQHADIPEIGKLENIIEVPSYKLIDTNLENFVPVCNIFPGFFITAGFDLFVLEFHFLLISRKCYYLIIVEIDFVQIVQGFYFVFFK